MGQGGISPLLCSHRVVCSPSQNGVTFLPTLLSIPQPHRIIIFLMEVEGLLYDHHPHDQMSLLDAMNAECLDIARDGSGMPEDSFLGVLA